MDDRRMNGIQKYFRYRQSLIDQYKKGDLTKKEYLQLNYNAVCYSGIGPFRNIDTVEKGLYNYQYYNALAKEMKAMSSQSNLDYELKKEYLEKASYYYAKKDKATLKVLRMIDFKGVTAYFVKVRSKALRGKLFEIVLEQEDIILHSINTLILHILQEEGVFQEEKRLSKIDTYINQKY